MTGTSDLHQYALRELLKVVLHVLQVSLQFQGSTPLAVRLNPQRQLRVLLVKFSLACLQEINNLLPLIVRHHTMPRRSIVGFSVQIQYVRNAPLLLSHLLLDPLQVQRRVVPIPGEAPFGSVNRGRSLRYIAILCDKVSTAAAWSVTWFVAGAPLRLRLAPTGASLRPECPDNGCLICPGRTRRVCSERNEFQRVGPDTMRIWPCGWS
mmetsp:Transcript_29157/g.77027  ORF Transcript_29157/g.77027 Transcript_29157/m.77027 type:complete len:208 (-) Transcript_29157:549-1172(-)